ncbi:hypothetical protein HDU84_005229 [Entophlyctis sp. JEL0112]|nr:hypothetical protein HDU84_005229 [Entophlyctis sp. JEL0112]
MGQMPSGATNWPLHPTTSNMIPSTPHRQTAIIGCSPPTVPASSPPAAVLDPAAAMVPTTTMTFPCWSTAFDTDTMLGEIDSAGFVPQYSLPRQEPSAPPLEKVSTEAAASFIIPTPCKDNFQSGASSDSLLLSIPTSFVNSKRPTAIVSSRDSTSASIGFLESLDAPPPYQPPEVQEYDTRISQYLPTAPQLDLLVAESSGSSDAPVAAGRVEQNPPPFLRGRRQRGDQQESQNQRRRRWSVDDATNSWLV